MLTDSSFLFWYSRWTAKEAAYKAVYPLRKLRWSDLCVYKAGPRPLLRFSDDCSFANHTKTLRLHLSVSHDGDYCIAFVVAESDAETVGNDGGGDDSGG